MIISKILLPYSIRNNKNRLKANNNPSLYYSLNTISIITDTPNRIKNFRRKRCRFHVFTISYLVCGHDNEAFPCITRIDYWPTMGASMLLHLNWSVTRIPEIRVIIPPVPSDTSHPYHQTPFRSLFTDSILTLDLSSTAFASSIGNLSFCQPRERHVPIIVVGRRGTRDVESWLEVSIIRLETLEPLAVIATYVYIYICATKLRLMAAYFRPFRYARSRPICDK